MERTMTTIILILFTLIGVAVIVMVIGGFRGEFLVERIDCADPCILGPARCIDGAQHTCVMDGSGCPVLEIAECVQGCNTSSGTCLP